MRDVHSSILSLLLVINNRAVCQEVLQLLEVLSQFPRVALVPFKGSIVVMWQYAPVDTLISHLLMGVSKWEAFDKVVVGIE